jgi:hypothetical protein
MVMNHFQESDIRLPRKFYEGPFEGVDNQDVVSWERLKFRLQKSDNIM